MAWERRGNRRYYYRAQRVGSHVVKTYVGTGALGEQAAAVDLEAREARKAPDEAHEGEIEKQLDQLDQRIDAALDAHDFHRPKRGQWRRRRVGSVGR